MAVRRENIPESSLFQMDKGGMMMLAVSEDFIRMPLYWQVASLLHFWSSGDGGGMPLSQGRDNNIVA